MHENAKGTRLIQITSSNRFRKRSPWGTKPAENTSNMTNAKRNCRRFTLLTRSWMSFRLAALLPVFFILRLFLLLLDKQGKSTVSFDAIQSKFYPYNFMYINIKLRYYFFLLKYCVSFSFKISFHVLNHTIMQYICLKQGESDKKFTMFFLN